MGFIKDRVGDVVTLIVAGAALLVILFILSLVTCYLFTGIVDIYAEISKQFVKTDYNTVLASFLSYLIVLPFAVVFYFVIYDKPRRKLFFLEHKSLDTKIFNTIVAVLVVWPIFVLIVGTYTGLESCMKNAGYAWFWYTYLPFLPSYGLLVAIYYFFTTPTAPKNTAEEIDVN